MRASIEVKAITGLAAILIVLSAVGFFCLEQLRRQNEAREWVLHTHKVISELHFARATVKDAVIAEQSYALTGNEAYPKLFNESVVKANRLLDSVRDLTVDNSIQQRQVGSLASKVDEQFAQLKETIEMLDSKKHGQALKEIETDRGRKQLDDIRRIISEMQEHENQLLAKRTDDLKVQVKNTINTLIALIVLACIMLLLTSSLLWRFLKGRQAALIELQKKEKDLSDFFDDAVVALHWLGVDGRIMKANKAQCTMLGFSKEELLGQHIDRFLVDRSAMEDIMTRLKAHEDLHSYEARLRCKDDSIKTVIIDSNVLFENGHFITARCFTRDITLQKKAESELVIREARTRALVETAPDAIITFDSEGKIESTNNAASYIFGYAAAEMSGRNLSRFIPEFFTGGGDRANFDKITTGQSRIFGIGKEMIGRTKAGTSIPIEVAWSVLNLGDRSIFTAIVRDITERQAISEGLALQYAIANVLAETDTIAEMCRRVLQVAGEFMHWSVGAVWFVDQPENVLRCAEFWSLSRLTETEFASTSRSITFAPGVGLPGRAWAESKPFWIEDLNQDDNFPRRSAAAMSGLHSAFAFPILSDGVVLAVFEFFTEEIRNADDVLWQTLSGIAAQIGQFVVRKRVEEAHRLSESRFRQMAENINELFWITDARGTTPVYVSPAYDEIFGRKSADLLTDPKQFFEAVHPDDLEKLSSVVANQSKKGNTTSEVEYRIRRPDGEIRWLWARVCSLLDDKGQIIGLTGVTTDITAKKEAEARVSEFYSMVSHELRTPLTSIRGSLGLIEGGKTGELPPKAMQMIKIGRAESDRLIRLINDILDIKKIEGGHLELNKARLDPRKLVSKTLDAITGMATEARITLKSVVGTRRQIYADSERLTQVLTNLVSNAIKFSPPDSEVTVTVEARGDNMLRFAVSDHGPGIPAEQMSKLFGMFQQLDSSDSRRKGGTGLGLAISKSIVEQHRGKIGVESHVGEGSVFWFDVPADRSSQSDNDGSGVKILVVESDDYWTEVLNRVFSDSLFDAVYVDSTASVKKQLTENRPDLIVLDLQSTNGEGVEFLESLKLDPNTVDIPVVILSTDEQTVDHKGLAFLIDWIKKPFEPRQVKKAVANALKKNHSGPVTVLIVEDDPATREVLREQIGELGVTCLEAVDGLQAIDLARTQNLDLMILDLGLPLLDGFEVVKVLREDKSKHIPLIVYSNRDLSKDDKRNLSLGLTSHLVKSRTTDDELIVCVKDLLNGLLEVKT